MVVWRDKHAKYEAKRRGDVELLERKRADRRRHHAANADRLNEARKVRAKADPGRTRERQRRYMATEKGRASRRRAASTPRARASHAENVRCRRARLYGRPTEKIDTAVLMARQDGICGICGAPLDASLEVDHVVALARGGTHTYDNVQLAHADCNRRKGVN